MRSGLQSTPFFTVLRTLFLLVKFAFMATLTGLWHRCSNNLPLACLSLQPFWEVAGPDQRLIFSLVYKVACGRLCWGLCGKEALPRAYDSHLGDRNSSGGGASASVADSKKKGSHGGTVFQMMYNLQLHWCHLICCAGWYTSHFSDQWRNVSSNRFVLKIVKGHYLWLRAWHLLLSNFTGSTLRLLWLIILLSRMKCRRF